MRSPFCKLRDGERRKERKKGDQNEVKYIQMLSERLPDHQDYRLFRFLFQLTFFATKVLAIIIREKVPSEPSSSFLPAFPSGICPHVHTCQIRLRETCALLFSLKAITFCWTAFTLNGQVIYHQARGLLINFTALRFPHTLTGIGASYQKQLFLKAC